MPKIPVVFITMWERSFQTPGVCTICMATAGNGHSISHLNERLNQYGILQDRCRMKQILGIQEITRINAWEPTADVHGLTNMYMDVEQKTVQVQQIGDCLRVKALLVRYVL